MAERTIALVLKTNEVKASGGSNPPPSALVMSQDIGTSRTPGSGGSLVFEAWLVADVEVAGSGLAAEVERCRQSGVDPPGRRVGSRDSAWLTSPLGSGAEASGSGIAVVGGSSLGLSEPSASLVASDAVSASSALGLGTDGSVERQRQH